MSVIASLCALFSLSCATAAAAITPGPRAYWLAEINEESAKATMEYMDAAVSRGDHGVTIYIHSPGGGVWAGFELAKHIEQSPIPVTCIVDGYAASMASFIFESCQVRIMTRRSSLMFHQPSISDVSGNEERLRNYAERLRMITVMLVEHSAARMRLTASQLLAKIEGGKEYWLSGDEALRIGAVDRVVIGAAN